MAEKEATVYIIDVARSMGECHHGRSITDLEWAMQYVWDRITTTVRTLPLGLRHLLIWATRLVRVGKLPLWV